MKFITCLLVALFLGCACAATTFTISSFANSQCSGAAAGTISLTESQCINEGDTAFSDTVTTDGTRARVCRYSARNCAGTGNCTSVTNGACNAGGALTAFRITWTPSSNSTTTSTTTNSASSFAIANSAIVALVAFLVIFL